jgi:hypothetical protein
VNAADRVRLAIPFRLPAAALELERGGGHIPVMARHLFLVVVLALSAAGAAAAQPRGPGVAVSPPDVQFDLSRARTDAQTAYAAEDQARTDLAVRGLEAARRPVLDDRLQAQSAIAQDREDLQQRSARIADSQARLERGLREIDDWYARNGRPR